MIMSSRFILYTLIVSISGGQNISGESATEFLGVLIDDKLSFAEHIINSGLKLSKSLGVIYRI